MNIKESFQKFLRKDEVNIITRRDFLKITSACTLLSTLPKLPKNLFAKVIRIPVLLYHDISEEFKDFYTLPPALFASQMEWLYARGYKVISLREVKEIVDTDHSKSIILTFDDGYASFMDYAFPFIKEYGFRATINILGKYVGTFIDIDMEGNRPMLSWDEYRYLKKSGIVDLGCHSYNMHIWRRGRGGVSLFSVKEQEEDLILFKEIFQKEIGSPVEILAWPYGQYDKESIEIARKAGFNYLLTSKEGYLTKDSKFQEIPRITINNKFDLDTFKNYLEEIT